MWPRALRGWHSRLTTLLYYRILCDMRYELKNKRFGKWLVVEKDLNALPDRSRWICKCDCGFTKSVMTQNLINGQSQGCGKGVCAPALKHGGRMNRTPEYAAWVCMKQRCLNPKSRNFKTWGGRGIKIHPEWINDFEKFLSHVGLRPSPKHSLDRIGNEGNYEPGNVRWALPIVQQNNKRSSKIISHAGKTQSVAQWSRELGIHRNDILRRLKLGWSIKRALTEPSRGRFWKQRK